MSTMGALRVTNVSRYLAHAMDRHARLMSILALAVSNGGGFPVGPGWEKSLGEETASDVKSLIEAGILEHCGPSENQTCCDFPQLAPDSSVAPPSYRYIYNIYNSYREELHNKKRASVKETIWDGATAPTSRPIADTVVLEFKTRCSAGCYKLRQSKIDEYQNTYPDIDVPAEMRRAWQWCEDNPRKRKTVAGMTGFLNRWLGSAKSPVPIGDGDVPEDLWSDPPAQGGESGLR